ncbi:unnamed protein product [Arctia plantaginis]|uniref:Uncharacterized protein n=1 Tax=Arctia plantaginis TaxID=874455 RepID=A0A8S0YR97_ARCPL|nr:unnamed protein product [Arctia plantaginis]
MSHDQSFHDERANVTVRQKGLSRAKSMESIIPFSLDSTDAEDIFSCLDLSSGHDIEIIETVRAQNKQLKQQLDTANHEIDNLHLEVNQLKNMITAQKQQISSLKEICKTPTQTYKQQVNSKRRISRRVLMDNTRFIDSKDDVSRTESGTVVDQNNILEPETLQTTGELCQEANTNKTNFESVRNTYIFGGRQCRHLSIMLTKSRLNTRYEKYSFSSIIKPEATSMEILRPLYSTKFQDGDKFILSIGEHDDNPMHITSELSAALKLLQNHHVIVLGITQNKYLNESKLNEMLKLICSQFTSCNFVTLHSNNNYYNENYTIDTLCKWCNLINVTIDQYDYNLKYIKHIKLRLRDVQNNSKSVLLFSSKLSTTTLLKQKTIPDYFPIVKKDKELTDSCSQHIKPPFAVFQGFRGGESPSSGPNVCKTSSTHNTSSPQTSNYNFFCTD